MSITQSLTLLPILDQDDMIPSRWTLKLASRHQREGVDVVWPDDGEVAVNGCNLSYAQSFGRGHNGCVDGAEREVAVPSDEFSDAQPIGGSYRLDAEGAICQVPEEAHLGSVPRRVPST